MRSLQTARICVIDDEVDEYLPMIQTLGRLGLGCVHVAGDRVESLPPEPIHGLRLVFLDMKLGTEGDDALITSHTAKVFSRVVASGDGPVLVIVWTKHDDLVDPFRQRLYDAAPAFRGRLVFARMDKPTRAELIETNRLREAVVAELKKFYPLEVVWRWEQIVHHAASASIEEICRLAGFRAGLVATDSESDETKKLLAGISSILAILVNAEAGKTAAPASTFADLVRILNSMHLDRCEHGIAPEDSEVASAIAECGSPQPSVEEQIALNSMLLVGPLAEGGCPFAPGALYGVDDPGLFKGLLGVEPSDVGRHVLNLAGEPSITDIRRRMKTNGLTANEKATLRVDLTREEDRLLLKYLGLCRPILVEVSPVCDFAQHKRPLARLIAGLAVPPNGVPIARSGDAVWRFETVKIAGLPQPVVLVFSSRFVFGLDAKVVPRGIVQLGRVREVVLSALRHWNAQQASRVGYALVRPAD